ncbi:MAG: FG-GAP-like repeat-containing protein [Planctomycetes bacterium]|nr:FG-GAP-like repeat-containing protein [Planctomycetota bacterium]
MKKYITIIILLAISVECSGCFIATYLGIEALSGKKKRTSPAQAIATSTLEGDDKTNNPEVGSGSPGAPGIDDPEATSPESQTGNQNQAPQVRFITVISGATPGASSHSGDIHIAYTLSDPDSATRNLAFEYSTTGTTFDGMTELPGLPLSEGANDLTSSSGGTLHRFTWQSGVDLPGAQGISVLLRIRFADDVSQGSAEYGPIIVDNNDVPSAAISAFPSTTVSGDVSIGFVVSDSSSEPVNIVVQYSLDGGKIFSNSAENPMTESGSALSEGTFDLATSPAGVAHTFVWSAISDLGESTYDGVVFRITPFDSKQGTSATSLPISVTNNTPPSVTLDAVPMQASGDVLLGYTLRDSMSHPASVLVEYTTDGEIFRPATRRIEAGGGTMNLETSPEGASHTFLWNSVADVGEANLAGVRLRVTPGDARNTGEPRISTSITIDNNEAPRIALLASLGESTVRHDKTIPYALFDSAGDYVNLLVEYRIADEEWAIATESEDSLSSGVSNLETSNVGPGEFGIFVWDSLSDLGANRVSQVFLRFTPVEIEAGEKSQLAGNPVITGGFSVDNSTAPIAIISAQISGTQSGFVTLAYNLIDMESDTVSILQVEYSTDSGVTWTLASFGSGGDGILGLQASPMGTSHEVVWSSFDVGLEPVASVMLKITPKDTLVGQSAITAPFAVDNTDYAAVGKPPVVTLVPQKGIFTGDVPVTFRLFDSENHPANVLVEYSIDGGNFFTHATESIEGSDGTQNLASASIFPGETYIFRWDTNADIGNSSRPTVQMRFTPSDVNGAGLASTTVSFAVNNNSAPGVSITQPADIASGNVGIGYLLSDSESHSVSIEVLFSMDGGASFFPATAFAGGDGIANLASSPAGILHTFLWNSMADIGGVRNENARVRIIPSDNSGVGTEDSTMNFTVDNNGAPGVVLETIADDQRADVFLYYELSDSNADPASIFVEFSIDGGVTFGAATESTHPASEGASGLGTASSGFSHVFVWDSFADAPSKVTAAVLRLTPSDAGGIGESKTTNAFAIDNSLAPEIEIDDPAGVQQLTVSLTYRLFDAESHDCQVLAEYSTDAGVNYSLAAMGAGGDGVANLASSPSGVTHTFVWNSAQIGPIASGNVRLRIRPSDSQSGEYAETSNFSVDNTAGALNSSPSASVESIAGLQSGDVLVAFDLFDVDGHFINLQVQYRGGSAGGAWKAATVSGQTIGLAPAAGYSLVWKSGSDQPNVEASDLEVRVIPSDAATGAASGTGTFSIDNSAPVVTLTSPSGGGFIAGGQTLAISWNSAEANKNAVDIEYTTNGVNYIALQTGTPDDGAHTITVPALNTSAFRLRVTATDLAGNSGVDVMDQTMTVDSTPPVVSVTSPSGGEIISGGASFQVTWTTSEANRDVASIEYTVDGSTFVALVASTADDGSETVTIPALNTSSMAIRVTATDKVGKTHSDISAGAFTVDSTAPVVTLVSPSGGEILRGGDPLTVTWSTADANANAVSIDYTTNGVAFVSLASSIDDDGEETVIVPSINSPSFKIRVTATDKAMRSGIGGSNSGIVVDSSPPVVTVTSPAGGEFISGAGALNVTWTSVESNKGLVDIHYTTDGISYVLLSAGTPDDGATVVTVPSLGTSTFRIRVTATDDAGFSGSDLSGGPLTIDAANPAVVVTYPAGGEFLSGGSTATILWTVTETNRDVASIEYSSDGATYLALLAPTDDDGSESVTLPALNSGTVRIRVTVTDKAGRSASDLSDADFAIDSTSPAVSVTSPNGGEFLRGGDPFIVTWTSVDANPDAAKIEYTTNGVTFTTLLSSTEDDGSEIVTIPSLNVSTFRIRVTVTDKAGRAGSDTSDAALTIDSLAPTITVTSPAGGEFLRGGDPFIVTWSTTDNNKDVVNIDYTTDGLAYTNLASGISDDGSETVTLPALNVSTFRIRVTATDSAGYSAADISDSPSTLDSVDPSVIVTSPNGGEFLSGGAAYTIAWTSTDSNKDIASIDYTVDGTNYVSVIAFAADDGSEIVTMPALNVSTFRIRVTVTDKAGRTGAGVSNANLTIDSANPAVVLTSPSGGEYIQGGATFEVTWSNSETNKSVASIDYTTDGVVFVSLASSVPDDGSEFVTIPALNTSAARLRVTVSDKVGRTSSDMSDSPLSVDSIPPVVLVTSPNGGEFISGGTALSVAWTSTETNKDRVNIEYTTDGVTYASLASSVADDGAESVTVPTLNSSTFRIRVTAIDLAGLSSSDIGNSPSTVDSADPSVVVTSPAGGEFISGGSTFQVAWTSTETNKDVVQIAYTTDDATFIDLIASTPDDGTENVTIPSLNVANFKIRVTAIDKAGRSSSDLSDSGCTIDSTAPVVTLTSPNGGEYIAGGTIYSVTWNSVETNKNTVSIDFATNGTVFTNLISGASDDGSESVTIPFIESSSFRIRVTATDKVGRTESDQSDGTLTIDSAAPVLALDFPAGGEFIAGGTAINVVWNSTENNKGTVNIDYTTDGIVYTSLDSGTPDDGSQIVTVPSLNSGTFRIRVTAFDLAGKSSNVIQSLPATIDSIAPTIDLLYPNGGEYLSGGSSLIVTWASVDANKGTVLIEYTTDVVAFTTVASTPDDGSHTFTLPSLDLATFRIRITATDKAALSASDLSDGPCSIDSTAPVVTVTSPNGGEFISGGSGYLVTWNCVETNKGTVSIEYTLNGSAFTSLLSSTPDDGSEVVVMPSIDSATFEIRVAAADLASRSGADVSNAGATIDSTNPIATVISPNGGEILAGGSALLVTWASAETNKSTVDIDYTTDGLVYVSLASGTADDGSHSVTVPALDTSSFRIRITATDLVGRTGVDHGGSWSAVDSTAPAVTVTSPNGGEYFGGGNVETITWDVSDANRNVVSIAYTTDGFTFFTLAASTADDGSHAVTIPSIDSSTLRIRVTATDGAGLSGSDLSDATLTIDSTGPIVTVTSPNGGETFLADGAHQIRWTTTEAAPDVVTIEYSTDGFAADVNALASGISDSGSYLWDPVANLTSSTVTIRVTATDLAGQSGSDESNADFTIDGLVFVDQSAGAGLGSLLDTRGASWADYDLDGDIDLMVTTSAADLLYQNNGNSTFTEVAASRGVTGSADGYGAVFVDFDLDGDTDIYVCNHGQDFLYENDGSANFVNVATVKGIVEAQDSYAAAWADFDGDWDLDFYLAGDGVDYLFINDGAGNFTDFAAARGMTASLSSRDAAWIDFNRDGYVDLFVATTTADLLYQNDGAGSFTEVASLSGISGSVDSRSAAVGDFNNDGWMDIFVSTGSGANRLYKNVGGTFVLAAAGVESGAACSGVAWGDYDNDGDLDLFVGTDANAEALLYLNEGNESFTEVHSNLGMNQLRTHTGGSAFADFDGDGDLDIYVACGAGSADVLYENPGFGGGFVKVNLITDFNGDATDSFIANDVHALGALLEVDLDNNGDFSDGTVIYKVAGSGSGWLGQQPASALVGIGASNPVGVRATFADGSRVTQLGVVTGSTITLRDDASAPAPTITSITDSYDSTGGGKTVTIRGYGFHPNSAVTIGGNNANETYVSAVELSVVVPNGTLGYRDVVVTNPGAQSFTLTGGFFYTSISGGTGANGAFDSTTYVSGAIAGVTKTGSDPYVVTVDTSAVSTLNFTSFVLREGDTLTATGNSELTIRATLSVTINGYLDLAGESGGTPAAGVGVAGGGNGGNGGSNSNGSGGSGNGSGNGANQKDDGGGGGGFGSDGTDGEGGGGGNGGNANGSATFGSGIRAGSGGGGGGGELATTGGGGGAGGGGIRITSIGSIVIGFAGAIDCDGGNGGNASGTLDGGGGGGGSGGGIWMQAANIVIDSASTNALSADGGKNGLDANNGNIGGDGGVGRIRLEDLDGVVTGSSTRCFPAASVGAVQ